MSAIISANALMTCSFGLAPSAIKATNAIGVMAQGVVANALDATPANIPPFGMCNCMMNPAVITATAAALGTLTPQPCTFVPSGIWMVSKTSVIVKNAPVLTMDAKLQCVYGGVIQFTNTPSMKVTL